MFSYWESIDNEIYASILFKRKMYKLTKKGEQLNKFLELSSGLIALGQDVDQEVTDIDKLIEAVNKKNISSIDGLCESEGQNKICLNNYFAGS